MFANLIVDLCSSHLYVLLAWIYLSVHARIYACTHACTHTHKLEQGYYAKGPDIPIYVCACVTFETPKPKYIDIEIYILSLIRALSDLESGLGSVLSAGSLHKRRLTNGIHMLRVLLFAAQP